MMTGVISGEINSPITALRAGIAEFASPRAAKVPSEVASRVAETPMTKLLDQGTSPYVVFDNAAVPTQ